MAARIRALPWARISALALLGSVVGTMAWLLASPALQVSEVTLRGNQWTAESALRRAVTDLDGSPVLAVDPEAVAEQVMAVPGIDDVAVSVRLPGTVEVTVSEAGPALLWRTSAVTLLLNPDGVVIGAVARSAPLPADLAALPLVDDRRESSRNLIRGDQLDPDEVATLLRLAALTPEDVGSTVATGFGLVVDPRYGFVLDARGARWTAVFGFFGIDPDEDGDMIAARITSQTNAIRTLLATEGEATVTWIDVRDPGRVYFRAGG